MVLTIVSDNIFWSIRSKARRKKRDEIKKKPAGGRTAPWKVDGMRWVLGGKQGYFAQSVRRRGAMSGGGPFPPSHPPPHRLHRWAAIRRESRRVNDFSRSNREAARSGGGGSGSGGCSSRPPNARCNRLSSAETLAIAWKVDFMSLGVDCFKILLAINGLRSRRCCFPFFGLTNVL